MPRKKPVTRNDLDKTVLKTDVFNLQGNKIAKITLPSEIFGVPVNPQLLAQAVRIYLANQRAGTHKVKTRSETSGSTRKIYRQKGTGRARHGDIKAPIFVGGGIAHGPKIRNYSLNFPYKMKTKALFQALTQKFNSDSVKIVMDFNGFPPKTKEMAKFLTSFNLFNKKKDKFTKTLLVTDKVNREVFLASRNLQNLSVTPVNQLNTYEVMKATNVILMKKVIESLREKSGSTAISGKMKKDKKTLYPGIKTVNK